VTPLNRKVHKGKPCAGANFIINAETGKFLYFGVNIKKEDKILASNPQALGLIFRVVYYKNNIWKILSYHKHLWYPGKKSLPKLTEKAKKIMKNSAKAFNKHIKSKKEG